MVKRLSPSTFWSIVFLLIGTGIAVSLTNSTDFGELETERWKLVVPIILPLIGVVFGIIGVFKARRYFKLVPFVIILANLGLAALIFLGYAFSYWEF